MHRVFSITIPQHVSPAAKRSAAATALAAANVIEGDKNGDEHEAGFKHKWQADIAAAAGVDVMKDSKQKYPRLSLVKGSCACCFSAKLTNYI